MMKRKTRLCTLNLTSETLVRDSHIEDGRVATYRRLAQSHAWLERLETQRAAEQHPSLGKVIEERIIWRELLDLELQNIDGQIEQISARAGGLQQA